MNLDYTKLSGIAYFFRDGAAVTVPAAGTAGRGVKPDATDPAWLDMGHVDIALKPDVKTDDIYRGIPGVRVLYDKLQTQRGLDIMLTCQQLQNLIFEAILGSAALPNSPTAGGQFNQVTAGKLIRGWLKTQVYSGTDNSVVKTMDSFVAITPPTSEVKLDEKHVQVDLTCSVLWSQYNTGSLV
jgi:hypothetical protein